MTLIARVKVRVPASTSNLGPGFDCVGLALSLYNELTLELHSGAGGAAVAVSGEGAGALPKGEDNLMVRAARRVLGPRKRLVLKAVNRIPLARGLGSSAAAVLAGLYAANHLLKKPAFSEERLLRLACALEGHPDNAAAAARGGLVLSLMEKGELRVRPLKPHKDLAVVLCVPAFELATKKARAVLPAQVSRGDAVYNVARAMLLASALEQGRWEELAEATQDRLHQPYRARLMPGFTEALRAARRAGPCGAALSGAGPAILALCRKSPRAARIGRAMQRALLKRGVGSRVLVLAPDREGVKVWK